MRSDGTPLLSKLQALIDLFAEYAAPAERTELLLEYARKFKAGPQWIFLTGDLEKIVAVQKSFDAYRGNKMRHEPLTFLRAAPGKPWVRLDGLMSAAQLLTEYKRLIAE